MDRQITIFDDTVASRIDQLLQRCDQLRRGTTITRPTRFDSDGQRHARAVAAADVAFETSGTHVLSPDGGRSQS